MAVLTWLLLSLLTVQTVIGRGLHQRVFRDARHTLLSELEDLAEKRQTTGKGFGHFPNR